MDDTVGDVKKLLLDDHPTDAELRFYCARE